MKLQDAYVSESNMVGDWQMIGYVAPGAAKAGDVGKTTNFEYQKEASGFTNGSAAVASFNVVTWGAVNTAALNDCAAQTTGTVAASANWKITVTGNSNGNSLSYDATVSTNCQPLTATFSKIGK